MNDIRTAVAKGERATAPVLRYAETRSGCELDLSDNTNLWGTPPSARSVLSAAVTSDLSRYPSAYSNELKLALARYAGVDPSMIVVGCGSDDVLDSAVRSLASPGDTLVTLDPTFTMIPKFAAVSGIAVTAIPFVTPDLPGAFGAASGTLTYLCSPNNPTGTTLSREAIHEIARTARGMVIIDEAYTEFAGTSCLDLLRGLDNVFITRTMSKAFGLAGLRIGYGIGAPHVVARVEAARGPYKLTSVAERVATAVLGNDMEWVEERTLEAVTNRRRFARELATLGMPPLESSANFVLVPVGDSALVEGELRARGIAVRRFVSLNGIGDAVRISIGPWDMMKRCLEALDEAMT